MKMIVALALTTATLAGAVSDASAADLFRHHHRSRHHGTLSAYAGDNACPPYEASDYRPRTTNFNEPLCYAARPYGISTHLYDISTDLLSPASAY